MARTKRFLSLAAFSAVLCGMAFADGGHIFTLGNEANGNTMISFSIQRDGKLAEKQIYATDGLGTGAGLASQGSVSVSGDGRIVISVNAGSNSISLFRKNDGELEFLGSYSSGGVNPISVTQSDRFVYVLNGGDATHANNLQEFVLYHGGLVLIPDGTSALSGPAVGPAEVSFTPDGNGLVVTEKNTNLIDSISLDWFDRPTLLTSFPSSGPTPYGFAFGPHANLFVAEAFGGTVGASALSSYKVRPDLTLNSVSSSVPTYQTAACWTATAPDGRFVYASNTGSGNVTGYSILDSKGRLKRLKASGISGVTGGATIDSAFDKSGKFFYVLSIGTHATITEFRVESDGDLTKIGSVSGLPASTVGLATN